MGDYLEVEKGSKPWQPSPEARLVTTYDFYNFATAGVLESRDAKYLFLCVQGIADAGNAWTYTFITNEELQDLEATPPAELYLALRRFMVEHPTLVAVALEGPGIIGVAQQEGQTGSPEDVALSTALGILQDLEAQFDSALRTPA